MARRNGTNGPDFLIGTPSADILVGRDGDDVLNGLGGGDRLLGGFGSDVLYGGDGDDLIRPGGNTDLDRIVGSGGDDLFNFAGEIEAGGFNFVLLDYAPLAGGISAKFTAGGGRIVKDAGGTDLVRNVPADADRFGWGIVGTQGDDRLAANVSAGQYFEFTPMGGSDLIIGGAGFDRLSYFDDGPGIVVRVGRADADGMHGVVRDGLGGRDVFRRIDEIRGTDGDDRFRGSGGDDAFITDAGNDIVDGRGGFDLLNYDRAGLVQIRADLLKGEIYELWTGGGGRGAGLFLDSVRRVEHIRGSDGADVIRGRGAAERLEGGGGDDLIGGRGGADALLGGAGADRFEFRPGDGRDVILDWSDGEDRLRLKATADVQDFGDLTVRKTAAGDALVLYENVRIVLEGVARAEVDATDVLFF